MKTNTVRKHLSRFFALAFLVLVLAVPASADSLQDSSIYTGTSALLTDLMTVLTILCPVVGGIAAVVFAIRRSMADPQDGKMWQNRIVTAIICGVGGGLISGVIALISSYYTT